MANSSREVIFNCLKLLLRPIINFCLKKNLKIQDLVEAAKIAYVDVSAESMEKEGVDINFSRISVMTGMQRREVRRLYTENPIIKKDTNLLHRVLNQWSQDPKFTTKNKKPRVLELEGMTSEFVELVQSVSTDLNPYTVLFELERIGAVEKEGTKVKMVSDVYIPEGVAEKFELLSTDSNNLICSVNENIFEDINPKNLHVTTFYDNISPDKINEIKNWFLQQGVKFHEEAREYLSKYDLDLNPALKDAVTDPKSKINEKEGFKAVVTTFSRIEGFQKRE